MKVAVFTGTRAVEIKDVPIPKPKEDEILVKMKTCAICTWDQRAYAGINPVKYPFVGGHEMFLTILEIGSCIEQGAFHIGDKVALGLMSSCGSCYYCNRAEEGICENFDYNSVVGGLPYAGTGGFSEYLVVKPRNIFLADNTLEDLKGAFAEPLSCVHHSIESIGDGPFDTVIIIGAGTMGILHLMMIKNRAEKVVVSEPDASRRAFALKMGASEVIDPKHEDPIQKIKSMTGGRGADVVIDTTAVLSIAEEVLHMAAPMGTVMYYSSIYPKKTIALDPNVLHKTMINITGSANSNTRDFTRAVKLLSSGEINPEPLISRVMPFSKINEALELSMLPDNYRTVLTFE